MHSPMEKYDYEYAPRNARCHSNTRVPVMKICCERIYRDRRITNIYDEKTQLQVVAAIRHVTTGTYLSRIREYEAINYKPELGDLKKKLMAMTETYEQLVAMVLDTKDNEYLDFQARRLVEAGAHCVMGYLLLQDANVDETYRRSSEVYINYGQAEVK